MRRDLEYKALRSKDTKELIMLVRFEFNFAKRNKRKAELFGECFMDNEGYFNQVVVTFKKG